MPKELRIPFDKLRDPQTITEAMEREFNARDLDLHVNDVVELEDDHDKGVRVLKVRNTKYHFMS